VPSQRRFRRELRGSDLLVALGVAVLYVAGARLGLALALQAPQVSAVWPPTGLALVALLRLGPRAVPGIFLGAFLANATAQEPLWVAAGIAIGNTLEAMIGAAFLRRVGFDDRLARPRDALALLGAALVSPLVSATIGVVCLGAGQVQPASSLAGLWRVWWLGDALGDLILAPLLLLWTQRGAFSRRKAGVFEAVGLLAGLVVVTALTFGHRPPTLALEYLVFPFLIWGGLRFGPPATATVTAATYAVAVWATHRGLGPFAGSGPEGGLIPLQVFMAVASMTGLLFGAIAAQHRQARESAQLSERRLLLALTAARMGVWDWDVSTGEVRWSGELEPLHGLPRGGFAGTYEAFRALIHPDDRERVEAAIRTSVETRAPYEEEFRILGADRVERWTDARGQVVEDEKGRPIRMVGVGIDVSRQKHLEEELRQQAEQMREADRRKDEFLAMLAHELRNPLAPILHAVELLGRRDPALADRAREIIRRQAGHLTRLVDDLLDVSRITRGKVRLEVRRVTLGEVVSAAVDVWRHLISERRQELSVDLPDEPVWLEVDPTRLAQTISNLLHNAANFTPEAGRIAITASREDGSVLVRVRDTGAGMSPDVLARVFDLFVQGPPPPGRPHGGLGLGLTLVRRLVELHGGTVEALSEGPGRGCEFVLRIPAAAASPEARPTGEARREEAVPRAAVGSRRVLVVDDNEDAREALRFLLEEDGQEVRTAGDGPGAIVEARNFRPHVVLLDIALPGLDGYAVARALRKMPECDGALIVAVSGYGQAEDRTRSREAGFDEHLLKPVAPERLLGIVRRSLETAS
jgi:two-component system CheB/CheR fusion protein